MPFKIRRIVTAHDPQGKAIIDTDEEIEALPGAISKEVGNAFIWATDTTPAGYASTREQAARQVALSPPPAGSIFRILELSPGTEPLMHCTDTIDYVIVLDGEVDMVMDDCEVHLRAGDVMVQQATWHGWANRGDRPCRIAFVLVAATPPPHPRPHSPRH